MLIYSYTAKDKNGKIVSGELEAENESSAAKLLMSKEYVPITVTPKEERAFSFLSRVSLKEKVVIIRQLSTMITAGLPISESIKTLEEQITKKNVRRILSSAYSDVEGGMQLSVALSRFPEVFNSLDITLISTGETSGTLDKALARLADQLEKQQSLNRKIRGAFVYPSFVILVVVVVAGFMVIYVMPQMEDLYSSFDAKLPLLTRIMIAISNGAAVYFPILVIVTTALVIYIRTMIKRPAGRKTWDSLKLRIYGINVLLKKLYMARFSRTLAGLIATGVDLLASLRITAKSVGNVIYEEALIDSEKKVKGGKALSETLGDYYLFPPVVKQMIQVGEKTGEMDKMLDSLADYFEEELDTAVKTISTLIEPVIIVLLAIIIGVMLIAIMMPIYSLGNVL